MLLHAYPLLAPLAARSDRCLQAVAALSAAAAAHCAPRDALTVLLEAVDALLHGAEGDEEEDHEAGEEEEGGAEAGAGRRRRRGDAAAAAAATLAALVPLLAPLLARIQRRRGAFMREALAPVAAAARLVGRLLRGADAGGAASAFAARQLRVFADFACEAERGVVAAEADEAERGLCARRLAGAVLQLLAALTLGWLFAGDGGSSGDSGHKEGAAEAGRLLRLLRERLGVADWRQLEALASPPAAAAHGEGGGGGGGGGDGGGADARTGAALAALYGLELGSGPEPPREGTALLTVSRVLGCVWFGAVVGSALLATALSYYAKP